jgi:hypothetical protein
MLLVQYAKQQSGMPLRDVPRHNEDSKLRVNGNFLEKVRMQLAKHKRLRIKKASNL